ncbi:hypothetical protein [Thalassobacillus pellis]|uniref:hypothetical protein n=1 Tax=Thalassobacillus pellis TaxID=748008 RepID=UPI0019619828|nr:hypothetical protein [Thalassobacillus pellis]MBM7553609.1 hypothetical protein [Thalassobacillus pellis]
MILAYIVPLALLVLFFLSVLLLLGWVAKLFLFILLVWLTISPFILLYIEEVREKRSSQKT